MEIENHATIFLMVNMASGIDHGSMRRKTATQHGSHIPANRSTEAFRPGLQCDSCFFEKLRNGKHRGNSG